MAIVAIEADGSPVVIEKIKTEDHPNFVEFYAAGAQGGSAELVGHRRFSSILKIDWNRLKNSLQ